MNLRRTGNADVESPVRPVKAARAGGRWRRDGRLRPRAPAAPGSCARNRRGGDGCCRLPVGAHRTAGGRGAGGSVRLRGARAPGPQSDPDAPADADTGFDAKAHAGTDTRTDTCADAKAHRAARADSAARAVTHAAALDRPCASHRSPAHRAPDRRARHSAGRRTADLTAPPHTATDTEPGHRAERHPRRRRLLRRGRRRAAQPLRGRRRHHGRGRGGLLTGPGGAPAARPAVRVGAQRQSQSMISKPASSLQRVRMRATT